MLGCALLPIVVPTRPLPRWSDKPGTVSVFLVARDDFAPLQAVVRAEVHVRPAADVRTLTVSLSATGGIDVPGEVETLHDLHAGVESVFPAPFRVRAEGEGEVRATVTGVGADGAGLGSTSAVLYVSASRREVLTARTGFLDLRLARLDRQLAAHAIVQARHASAAEALRGGGAVEASVSLPPLARSATVSGHVFWTDRDGGTHPVRFAVVQLLTEPLAPTPLAVTSTDASGGYRVQLPKRGAFLVRVLAQGPGFNVKSATGVGQHIDSALHVPGPGRGVVADLTANNVDDNNTAFSVADALATATAYVERLHGSRFADIDVIFPADGTFFDPVRPSISLLRLDRFDWDVLLHEFGHYVSQNLRIDRSPGGAHGPGNLGETHSKSIAIRLAWSEGWPTFFSISAQKTMSAAAFGIPFVGDTRYSDTEDSDFDYDLETQSGGSASSPGGVLPSLGEDDEVSVQRILWDLFDDVDDSGDTISFGDQEVWSRLDETDSGTLSEAYPALVAGRTPATIAAVGCILTEHRVAPAPTSPEDGGALPTSAPTFTWVPNGGGPKNRNDMFAVEVYDAGFTTLLLASSVQSTTSFTPTSAEWNAVLSAAGGAVHWLVRGSQSHDPVTGPYRSCSRTLK